MVRPTSRGPGRRSPRLLASPFLALLALAWVASSTAGAATYYVDASPTGCGGARCSDASAGTTEATAFATPYGCIKKPLVAGDTCLIKNGTYRGTPTGSWVMPAFDFGGINGTPSSYVVVKNYPNHKPLLCVDNGGTCADVGVVIGSPETGKPMSYIRFEGLHVQGEFQVWGGSDPTHHVTVTGNELEHGGGACDKNWAIFRVENAHDIQFDHNWIHNPVNTGYCADSAAGIKEFSTTDFIVEFNTIERGNAADNLDYTIDLKDCPIRNIVRYNIIRNKNLRFANQGCPPPGSPSSNSIYGNLFDGTSFFHLNASDSDSIYNNTFVNGGTLAWNSEATALTRSNVFNNILHNPSNTQECNSSAGCNAVIEDVDWTAKSGYRWDYNAYDSDANFAADRYGPTNSTETSLASWRTRSGFDTHSFEGNTYSGGPCQFNNPAAGDYTLATGSPCKTAGCADWPVCATKAEVGAYGVTNCVGSACAASSADPDTLPPVRSAGAPTGSLPSTTTQTTLSLLTNENATCRYSTAAGTAYTSMNGSFSTTGQTSHSTTVSGLTSGGSYTYYVRCKDTAGNTNSDDYAISFTVASASTGGSSCASPPAGTIFCDDFENTTNIASRYTDYGDGSGRFVPTTAEAHGGTHAMSARYDPGVEQSGYFWYNFGRNPAGSKTQTTTDFTEIYWRVWMKVQNGFQGNPMKVTRARVVARSDYSDAATGHLWDGSSLNLALDPATGIAPDGHTLKTSGYNDFNDYTWLGLAEGSTQVYDASHQGRWQCIEVHMKLNTPGQSNGVFELWVDGNLDASRSGLNWRGSFTDYGINHVTLENWWNNGAAPKTEYRYFDDFMVSTQRIGCGSGGSDTTPPPSVNQVWRTDQR